MSQASIRKRFTHALEAISAAGLRTVRVGIETEIWDGALNTTGNAVNTSSIVEMLPPPDVSRVSSQKAEVLAARIPGLVGANGLVTMFELADIPRDYTVGGHTLASLLTPDTSSTSTRCLIRLAGEEHGEWPGTQFEVIDVDMDDPFVMSVVIRFAQQREELGG